MLHHSNLGIGIRIGRSKRGPAPYFFVTKKICDAADEAGSLLFADALYCLLHSFVGLRWYIGFLLQIEGGESLFARNPGITGWKSEANPDKDQSATISPWSFKRSDADAFLEVHLQDTGN
jgi:hypothetical protein